MPVALSEFATRLAKSALVSEEELATFQRESAASGEALSGEAAAARLVERGLLTRWQARMMLAGRTAFFLGRYKLLSEIGRGGMGAVFKAEQTPLGRVVALKVMDQKLVSSEKAVARFRREIQAAAALVHPNVVTAIDADRVKKTHFLVMEFVEGESLEAILTRAGPLAVPIACDYIRQAALGLAHAHERGMAHRDIKPSNLLVSGGAHGQGLVKILDFGLARFTAGGEGGADLTATGQVMGTPDYIAPEQAVNTRSADIRSDIFSLGCTLFRCLTGGVPFGGRNAMEKLMARLNERPRALESLLLEAPAGLARVVDKMLARTPDDRYQTPQEVAQALEPFCQGPAAATERSTVEFAAAEAASEPTAGAVVIDTSLDQIVQDLEHPSLAVTAPARPVREQSRKPRFGMRAMIAAGVLIVVALCAAPYLKRPGGKRETTTDRGTRSIESAQQNEPAPRSREPPDSTEELAELEARLRRDERAAAELAKISAAAQRPETTRDQLVREVAALRATFAGTRSAVDAARLLAARRSPLDDLPLSLPRDYVAWCTATGKSVPAQVVGVLGEHRGRHLSAIRAVAASPDGRHFASGGESGVFHLWDAETLEPRAILPLADSGIWATAFSPDSRLAAACGVDRTLYLVDVGVSPAVVRGALREHPDQLWSVGFSADGRTVAAGAHDGTISLWNIAQDPPVAQGRVRATPDAVWGLEFSADGGLLATACGDGSVRMWDLTGDEPVLSAVAASHTGIVFAVALSRDAKTMVSGGEDGQVIAWRIKPDAVERKQVIARVDAPVFSVAITADARQVAAGGADAAVRLFALDGDAKPRPVVLEGHTAMVRTVAFAAGGERIVSVSSDQTIRLWDVATKREVFPTEAPLGATLSAAFSDDASLLVSGGADRRLRVWDVAAGRVARTIDAARDGSIMQVAFTTDKVRLVAREYRGFNTWDRETGKKLSEFSEPQQVWTVPAGARTDQALVLDWGHSITLFDTRSSRALREFKGHSQHVYYLDVSPDGRQLVSSSDDKTVRLWDLERGTELAKFQVELRPGRLAFAPDGELIYGALDDGSINCWIPAHGPAAARWSTKPHASLAWGLAVSPDGALLASGDADGLVVVVDAMSGQVVSEMRLPVPVRCLAFASDCRHLACATDTGAICLIRLAEGPPESLSAEEAAKRQEALAMKLGVESTIEGSQAMKFVLIPPGRFTMGSPVTDVRRMPQEIPEEVRTVERPFYLGVHEVTIGQYEAFASEAGYQTAAERDRLGCYNCITRKTDPSCTWRTPGWQASPDLPVTCLTLADTEAFCHWLSGKDGVTCRLPTETEWEHACRAGSTTAYSFGDNPDLLTDPGRPANEAKLGPRPVGSRPPNAWGLFDVHGNVWERCAGGEVTRGGAWFEKVSQLRSASRYNTTADRLSNHEGFRVLREIGD